MDRSQLLDRAGRRALLIYFAIWAAATGYIASKGGDWTFPIASLVIFGLMTGTIIWFLTRKMDATAVPVSQPKRESLALLAYIVVYAVLLIGIGLGLIKRAIAPATLGTGCPGYKLLIHVVIPAGILLLMGGAVRPLFDSGIKRRGFWTT